MMSEQPPPTDNILLVSQQVRFHIHGIAPKQENWILLPTDHNAYTSTFPQLVPTAPYQYQSAYSIQHVQPVFYPPPPPVIASQADSNRPPAPALLPQIFTMSRTPSHDIKAHAGQIASSYTDAQGAQDIYKAGLKRKNSFRHGITSNFIDASNE